jgi:DNA-binding XRE family transcriptional regulator
VASAIGVSRPTYASIETGKKELTISQAKKLSCTLGIDIDDLFELNSGAAIFYDDIKVSKKYKQMILNTIKYGADDDGRITKTKLAKLLYLADFIYYYQNLVPISGVTYHKLPRGPVAYTYFRDLDDLEECGVIARESKGKAILFLLVEKEVPSDALSPSELDLIEKNCVSWRGRPTADIVNFTHSQLPWQICRDNEAIPYGLITQEDPERVYGPVQL